MPTLYHGRPILGFRGRFDPERAFHLLAKYGIRNTFLVPTALKMMMKAVPSPAVALRPAAALAHERRRGDGAGGVPLGARGAGRHAQRDLRPDGDELHRRQFARALAGEAGLHGAALSGPSHRGASTRTAARCPRGTVGDVALARTWIDGTPDPVFFLGYWDNPEATAKKYSGEWCRTGDEASMDEDGYLWYHGRSDDVFKSAGYRIGPAEIENCLVKHPAVANAAVVPTPDPVRGALVKAFVRARARSRALRGAEGGDPRPREAAPRALPAAARDRVRRRAADDHHGQGAAPRAARARGAARYFLGSTEGVKASQ